MIRRKYVKTWLVCLIMAMPFSAGAQSYDRLWKQIDKARENSLPQTVSQTAQQILKKAEREKNYGQMLKAFVVYNSSQEAVDADNALNDIAATRKLIHSTDDAVAESLLHILLAKKYTAYLREYRSLIEQRPAVADSIADMREWSVRNFEEAILKECQAALANSRQLLQIKTNRYRPYVELGEDSRYYGHDAYSLCVREIANVYGEQFSPYMGMNNKWLERKWKLFKEETETYREREDRDAALLSAIDEARAKFAYEREEEKENCEKTFMQTLNSLITQYKNNQLCGLLYVEKANQIAQTGLNHPEESHPADLLAFCREGLSLYPKCKGIEQLREIINRISQKEMQLSYPDYVYPGKDFSAKIGYKGAGSLKISVYPTSLSALPEDFNSRWNKEKYIKDVAPVWEKSLSLQVKPHKGRAAKDWEYLWSEEQIELPALSREGIYVVKVSGEGYTADSYTHWLTVKSVIPVITPVSPQHFEVTVLDEETGHPVKGALISLYKGSGSGKASAVLTADKNGKVDIKDNGRNINSFAVQKNGQSPLIKTWFNGYNSFDNSDRKQEQLILITDRAIYRPGQTVYIKGIAYQTENGAAKVIPDARITMTLLDANQKECGKAELKTNEFGSVFTKMNLPEGGLNGVYTVKATGKISSSRTIRVEEYKRPSFEISFNKLEGGYHWGDKIEIKGNVKSFSGLPVQNQKVQFSASIPNRYGRYSYRMHSEQIAQGTVMTDADGNFTLPVELPGSKDAETVLITATLTDAAGETHTETMSFAVDKLRYQLSLSVPKIISKENLPVLNCAVSNLSGVPVRAKVKLSLHPVTHGRTAEIPSVYSEVTEANQPWNTKPLKELPSGNYRLSAEIIDPDGNSEKSETTCEFILFSENEETLNGEIPLLLYSRSDEFHENEPVKLWVGTTLKQAYIVLNIFSRENRVEQKVVELDNRLTSFSLTDTRSWGEIAKIEACVVKGGKYYLKNQILTKTRPNRELLMKWKTFRDKLEPGSRQKWSISIKSPDNKAAEAELLAMMYDASLDKLAADKVSISPLFPALAIYSSSNIMMNNYLQNIRLWQKMDKESRMKDYGWKWDSTFEGDSWRSGYGYILRKTRAASAHANKALMSEPLVVMDAIESEVANVTFESEVIMNPDKEEKSNEAVDVRTNFNETAFFYPNLLTDKNGSAVFEFTLPESLTKWSFRGYAHTVDMLTGLLEGSVTAVKEFSIQPNMPRFVRVGDKAAIAATIRNQSSKSVSGKATMTLFNPADNKDILSQTVPFSVQTGGEGAVNFNFTVSDKYDLLGVRIVAEGGKFSDGEQRLLPVLSDKAFMTEAVAGVQAGKGETVLSLAPLFNRHDAEATHRKLTVECTGNPMGYVIQAMPSLNATDCKDAISWAASLYVNRLAQELMRSNATVKEYVQHLKQTLEKGANNTGRWKMARLLAEHSLDETPWLQEAADEENNQKNIVQMFDSLQSEYATSTALAQLEGLQLDSGAWSWYKGFDGNRRVTEYVMQLLVRLGRQCSCPIGAEAESMKKKAWKYLHNQAEISFRKLQEERKHNSERVPSYRDELNYLYIAALDNEKPVEKVAKCYLPLMSRAIAEMSISEKAKCALIFEAHRDSKEADRFISSIREHLTDAPEGGWTFRDRASLRMGWGGQPVPQQVLAMEALALRPDSSRAIAMMKLWLIQQKRALSWDSTVAAADAVYALSAIGKDAFDVSAEYKVSLDDKVILNGNRTEDNPLAYEKVTIESGKMLDAKVLKVEKSGDGIAWVAAFASYLSPLKSLKNSGEALQVEKKYYVVREKNGEEELVPLDKAKVKIGDIVATRMTIRLERDMDFLSLRDARPAALEPLTQQSGYRFSQGLGYYMEIKDSSTNFFFDHLNRGVYVLTDRNRVARRGEYQSGAAVLECVYAPEFTGHSAAHSMSTY